MRTAIRDAYDANLEISAWDGRNPTATVIVKKTFAIHEGRCEPEAPEPLVHDFKDPALWGTLQPGSDFWPFKALTDFIVHGAAQPLGGRPAETMTVTASIGTAVKRVAVFGKREVRWTLDGKPWIGAPQPFTCIPLTWESAYGGRDPRIEPEGDLSLAQSVALATRSDHPGWYPRNPLGKGYVVAGPAEIEMPDLEDPDDLLTAERLLVCDPRHWYRQPIPACFAWVHHLTWPRCLWFGAGADAWYPAPDDDSCPEVRRGLLPAGYRGLMSKGVDPLFFQEAPLGLQVPGVRGGEPVTVEGMHPDCGRVSFRLPEPPAISFIVEGDTLPAPTRTHSVIVRPAALRMCVVCAATVDLPRTFLPGVHRHIPIAVSVGGDAPIPYHTPPTVHDQLTEVDRSAQTS